MRNPSIKGSGSSTLISALPFHKPVAYKLVILRCAAPTVRQVTVSTFRCLAPKMDPNADGYLVASFLRPGSMLRQIAEVRDIRDDWTGVTSTAERKKRQNRLNQRAHRRLIPIAHYPGADR